MFNENISRIDQGEANRSSEILTSKKERFKDKNIPLRQGSLTIPPELTYLIYEANNSDDNFISGMENICISEEKLREAEEKFIAYKKSNPDIKIEPMIVYGSVARSEAKRESDIDMALASLFLNKRIALFTPLEILGASQEEKSKIRGEIEERKESELLRFLNRYGEKVVSSADIVIDYIESEVMIAPRAREKNHSYETEEAKIVNSITCNFIETLNKLVDKGNLEKYGFHQYQLIKKDEEK